jgi:hypothetical protein
MAVNPLEYLGSGGSSLDYRGGMGGQGEDERNEIRRGYRTAGVAKSDQLPMDVADKQPASPVTQQNPGVSVDPNKNTPVAQTPTFAQLRNSGMARPAPPPLAPVQRAARPTMAQNPALAPGRAKITQSLQSLLETPSGYGAPQMQDQLDRFNANLDAEARQGRRRVDESLAGRGFYDGTEAARALGSYEQGLDRQRRDYAGNLAVDAARQSTQDRTNAINTALAATQGLSGLDREDARFAEDQRQYDDDFALREREAELRREQILRSLGTSEDQIYAGISADERRDLMALLDRLGENRIAGLE